MTMFVFYFFVFLKKKDRNNYLDIFSTLSKSVNWLQHKKVAFLISFCMAFGGLFAMCLLILRKALVKA